jgi:hypothetical protein
MPQGRARSPRPRHPGSRAARDDARTQGLMKSSPPRQLEDPQPYGEVALRLVRTLAEWLETTPREELVALRGKLQAFFQKVRAPRQAA